jgi:hypothetical protein
MVGPSPYAHPNPGHQLHHDPVAWIGCFENNFINQIFFNDFPLLRRFSLNIFLKIGESQGFWISKAMVLRM